MKAIVVYESHWGNTAAIARAIAEGLGPGARALTTAEAGAPELEGADLIVAGAPILGFSLPSERMVRSLTGNPHPTPPDVSHPPMRTWLGKLPNGNARAASFETRISWSPGSASKSILKELERRGYQRAAAPARFVVKGRYGPLGEGELERAKQWGAELAQALR